jgi:rubrerythrin
VGEMIEGKPVSIWTCTACGDLGIGSVRIDRQCGSYHTSCEAEFDTDEPAGWLHLVNRVLCPTCQTLADNDKMAGGDRKVVFINAGPDMTDLFLLLGRDHKIYDRLIFSKLASKTAPERTEWPLYHCPDCQRWWVSSSPHDDDCPKCHGENCEFIGRWKLEK